MNTFIIFAFKITVFLNLFSLIGCSTISYYSQSISGQMEIFFKQDSIDDVIENEDSDDKLKDTLANIVTIRKFASQHLKLPDNDSYLSYVDLERPYVVWNVFAAHEFSLQPQTWCYFIVGCVSYRGYFKEQDAIDFANKLKDQNLDIYVAGISAYSTLGWFDDPVLNTMLKWKKRSIAGLIFHELSHQVIYISDETNFNEAFASSVERLGTIQWILLHAPEQLPQYLAYLDAQHEFRLLLLKTRDQLDKIYESDFATSKKRRLKKEVFKELKHNHETLKLNWKYSINFDSWFNKPINNARLTSTMTYLHNIPAFYALFIQVSGNWERFYNEVLKMESLSKSEREQITIQLLENDVQNKDLVNLIKSNL